ncbi:hypothetical protein [Stieleria varia]|uniref:Chromosome partition protein Smc n=1 Tax=Stieleria varia TaxID=2528005 RepID=A0A5C6AT25_9BACT|nr:hypothetical protein [Stieleria varia]TWU02439.1 hypothetical protein Pla52n_34890 [Stieleria varia]
MKTMISKLAAFSVCAGLVAFSLSVSALTASAQKTLPPPVALKSPSIFPDGRVPDVSAKIDVAKPTPIQTATQNHTPSWVWGDATEEHLWIRQRFAVPGHVQDAKLEIAADDDFNVFINGQAMGSGHGWKPITVYPSQVATLLFSDRPNEILIQAINRGGPAGIIANLVMVIDGRVYGTGTNAESQVSSDEKMWSGATVVGEAFGEPWNITEPTVSQKTLLIHSIVSGLEKDLYSDDFNSANSAMTKLSLLSLENPGAETLSSGFRLDRASALAPLIQKTEKILLASALTSSKRVTAIQEIERHLEKSSDIDLLLDSLTTTLRHPSTSDDLLQLVVLSSIQKMVEKLESNAESLDGKLKAAKDELKAAKGVIKDLNESKEAATRQRDELQAMLTIFVGTEKRLDININEQVDKIKALEMVKPQTPVIEKQLADEYAILLQLKAQRKKVKSDQNEATAKIILLSDQLTATVLQIAQLESQLPKLEKNVTKATEKLSEESGARVDRLTRLAKFLVETRDVYHTTASRAVANQIASSIRSIEIANSGIKSLAAADTLLSSESAPIFETEEIGARVSASRISTAMDARNAADRPGVTKVAPYDPVVSPRDVQHYPLGDDRGKRVLRGVGQSESDVERAPGAEGAKSALAE